MRVEVVDAALTSQLRRAVLRPHWPAGTVMPGDTEPDAVHLAATDDTGTVIGCCLVLPAGYPDAALPGDWQLRGMATAAERRGEGVGSAVLSGSIDEVARRGGQRIWCNARTVACEFYRRAGFVADGAEFLHAESGIPHYRLYRQIPDENRIARPSRL